jgi:type I restriction-modification system DNA methylase subunit
LSQDTINNNASFIWSIAELLRGDFKQSEYGKVVLPFTILRRLDCLLEDTKKTPRRLFSKRLRTFLTRWTCRCA